MTEAFQPQPAQGAPELFKLDPIVAQQLANALFAVESSDGRLPNAATEFSADPFFGVQTTKQSPVASPPNTMPNPAPDAPFAGYEPADFSGYTGDRFTPTEEAVAKAIANKDALSADSPWGNIGSPQELPASIPTPPSATGDIPAPVEAPAEQGLPVPPEVEPERRRLRLRNRIARAGGAVLASLALVAGGLGFVNNQRDALAETDFTIEMVDPTTTTTSTSTTTSTTTSLAPTTTALSQKAPGQSPPKLGPNGANDTPEADAPQQSPEEAVIGEAAGMFKIESGDSMYNKIQELATGGESGAAADADATVTKFVRVVQKLIAEQNNRDESSLGLVYPDEVFQFTLPPDIAEAQQDIQNRFKLFS